MWLQLERPGCFGLRGSRRDAEEPPPLPCDQKGSGGHAATGTEPRQLWVCRSRSRPSASDLSRPRRRRFPRHRVAKVWLHAAVVLVDGALSTEPQSSDCADFQMSPRGVIFPGLRPEKPPRRTWASDSASWRLIQLAVQGQRRRKALDPPALCLPVIVNVDHGTFPSLDTCSRDHLSPG